MRRSVTQAPFYSAKLDDDDEQNFRPDGGLIARCVEALERAIKSKDERLIRIRKAELRRYGVSR